MPDVPLYMNRVAGWERISTAIAANLGALPHLAGHQVQLVGILGQFRILSSHQIALAASKQETTQEMQELFRLAETLADFLRTGVRQHYGLSSEKLVEFGLQPIRRRPRSPKPPEPPGPESTESASISTTPDTPK